MLRAPAATVLTGLALGCIQASAADAILASPYQPYDLRLNSFAPVPGRVAGVFLSVRIDGGRPLRLLLDSGARYLTMGTKDAATVDFSSGTDLDLVGAGVRPARAGIAASVRIGPVSFLKCPVAVVDGKVAEGVDGVVPLCLFSDFTLRVDLPRKTLSLTPYPDGPGTSETRNHLLLVRAALNENRQGYVLLDTGAFFSAISRDTARALGSLPIEEAAIDAGAGGARGEWVSAAVRFRIGEQEISPSELVSLDLSSLSRRHGVEIAGVLGYPALSRYALGIDYRTGLVTLEPFVGKRANRPPAALSFAK